MTHLLLATKTFLPALQDSLVSRPRLLKKLNEAGQQSCRLVLVSAGAGFGKSTLLADWVSGLGRPVAWLALDDLDNEPYQFWAYVIAAIQTCYPDACTVLAQDLRAPEPPLPNDYLAALINALAELPQGLLLVLDDFHAIENSRIQVEVAFFLEHLPPKALVAIATRIDPPLPLHRWRARGQLVELRADELRFTLEEASTFLRERMSLALGSEEIRRLDERTEGWAVGSLNCIFYL